MNLFQQSFLKARINISWTSGVLKLTREWGKGRVRGAKTEFVQEVRKWLASWMTLKYGTI